MDKGVSSISSYKKKNDVNAYTYVYTVILTLLPSGITFYKAANYNILIALLLAHIINTPV